MLGCGAPALILKYYGPLSGIKLIPYIMVKGPAEIAHGPMFIGFGLNILLYGIMITQVYLYFSASRKDMVWMRIFVAVLLVADTLNAVFDFVYLYQSLIIHFDDPPYLALANWVFATDPALTGIISCMVQLFFAWRVLIITRNKWVTCVIGVVSAAGAIGAILTTIEVGITPRFIDFQNFKPVVITWLSANCAGDILITTRRHKSGFESSDATVDRIIRLTVQTGFITACAATLDLVFYLADSSGTHLIFNFPLSKLYTNSLMSSLNSRQGWNLGVAIQSDVQCIHSNDTPKGPSREVIHFSQSHENTISRKPEVFVHIESHEMKCAEDGFDRRSQVYDISSDVTTESSPAVATLQKEWGEEQVKIGRGSENKVSLMV